MLGAGTTRMSTCAVAVQPFRCVTVIVRVCGTLVKILVERHVSHDKTPGGDHCTEPNDCSGTFTWASIDPPSFSVMMIVSGNSTSRSMPSWMVIVVSKEHPAASEICN